MILTCPACSTRYVTDPAALGATGRTVRCAKCGHSWHQTPSADELRRPDVLSPSLEPQHYTPTPGAGLPARIEPSAPRRRGGGLALAAVIVLIVIAGLYLGRARVVEAWPDAATLYAFAGLPVEAAGGLSLADVTLTRQAVDGHDTVIVEGRIRNESGVAQPVPALLAALHDSGNRVLTSWTVPIDAATLAAGAQMMFQTSLVDPPEAAQRLALTFAGGDG